MFARREDGPGALAPRDLGLQPAAVMHDSGTWMPVSDGAYRAASPAQIGEIAQRIEIGLREGAVDIGAGFPYTPAATRDELLALFRVAARTKTPIHVHITPGVAGLKEALALAAKPMRPCMWCTSIVPVLPRRP